MSSFYDLASLVMIPSGKKAGKVYSQKPLTTDGQLDFTRPSTATRIGPDGKIEKTRTNKLLYSNDFSNAAWVDNAGGCTRTSGQSGYDGTNNAWLLTQNGVTGFDNIVQNVSSTGVNTYSIYAKGSSAGFTLRIANTTDRVLFNLSTGSVASTFGNNLIDSGITAVGGGWYRCYLTANATIANLNIYPLWQSTSAESVTIQDAQLEPGLAATNVITTTSAAVSVGSVDNMPRLNYTPGSATSCPSLLLEPQRTNLVPQSELFSDYLAYNSSHASTSNTTPINNVFARSLSNTVTGTNSSFLNKATGSSNITTFSIFAKKGTYNKIGISNRSANRFGVIYDLNLGVITAQQAGSGGTILDTSIVNFGDGWFRVIVTMQVSNQYNIHPLPNDITDATQLYSDVNYSTTGNINIIGAQVEEGSYTTSYIPTFGATVTRVADTCSKTSASSLIGQAEGTAYVKFNVTRAIDGTTRVLTISDGTGNERIGISMSTNVMYAFIVDGGVTQAEITVSGAPSGLYKAAIAYKNNDVTFYLNGTQIGTDTSATMPTTDEVELGAQFGAGILGDEIDQTILFKTRLTNDQLAELTSTDS